MLPGVEQSGSLQLSGTNYLYRAKQPLTGAHDIAEALDRREYAKDTLETRCYAACLK